MTLIRPQPAVAKMLALVDADQVITIRGEDPPGPARVEGDSTAENMPDFKSGPLRARRHAATSDEHARKGGRPAFDPPGRRAISRLLNPVMTGFSRPLTDSSPCRSGGREAHIAPAPCPEPMPAGHITRVRGATSRPAARARDYHSGDVRASLES